MGETGSGKTTQLPQFIQDARLINGQIGVTQVGFEDGAWLHCDTVTQPVLP